MRLGSLECAHEWIDSKLEEQEGVDHICFDQINVSKFLQKLTNNTLQSLQKATVNQYKLKNIASIGNPLKEIII